MVRSLWRRDMLRLKRERSRWLGVVAQPLLFWLLIGTGMAETFRLSGQEDVDYLQYFFPGIVVMTILFTTIFATISIIEDRQSGFLQQVLVAPGSRSALVAGKVAGVTTLTLLQCALLLLVAPSAGYPLAGISWLPLVAVVVLCTVGLTGVNYAMAWRLQSAQAYHAVMSMVLIPLWVLSGAMFPTPDTPWLRVVMTVNPMTYAVDGLRQVLSPEQGSALALAEGPAGCFAQGGVACTWDASAIILLGFAILALALAVRASRRPAGNPA